MYEYFTIKDFNLKGKVVGVRVDINSPIIKNKIVLNERIIATSKTLDELSKLGAKIVVLAHQGRYGKEDCISLKQHAKLIEQTSKKQIKFYPEISDEKAIKKIQNLKNGEILLLENLQFYLDEKKPEKIKNNKILKLQNYFDYYIYDAFSKAHRVETSIIGFTKIPNIAGRVMEKELNGLKNIVDVKKPSIYVLGGAKPDDLIEIIEINLKKKKVDMIILTGVIGEIALMSQEYKLGKKEDFMKEKGYLNSFDKIKKMISKYKSKFILPKDFAFYNEKTKSRQEVSIEDINSAESQELLSKYLIQDIGKKTVTFNKTIMNNAASIYFKGPAGNFELDGFDYGTKNTIVDIGNSKAFSYLGGGHSVTAISKYSDINNFSYVSLAGGALVKFLSGETLPGVEVLLNSFKNNQNLKEDFLVIGSNTLDLGIGAPRRLVEFQLGDKIKVEEDFKTTVGGGGINVSIALARLGADISYLGKISHESKDLVSEVMNKNKVKIINSKLSKKSCAKSVLIDTKDNDRIIFTYRGQNADLSIKDFDFKDISAKNYYFTSLGKTSFETLNKLAPKIKKSNPNSRICFNLSSYLIRKEKRVKSLVKNVDILILNYSEAQEFTLKESIDDCFTNIHSLGPRLIIITDGANGAYCSDMNRQYYVSSVKPKRIVDTTGAGDSFGGTFFYYYANGFSIENSLKAAAQNASSVISSKGAQAGLMYGEDIKLE